MRKYTRPEMICRIFARENILTASSSSQTYETSMEKLQKDLTDNYSISSESIVSRSWN